PQQKRPDAVASHSVRVFGGGLDRRQRAGPDSVDDRPRIGRLVGSPAGPTRAEARATGATMLRTPRATGRRRTMGFDQNPEEAGWPPELGGGPSSNASIVEGSAVELPAVS